VGILSSLCLDFELVVSWFFAFSVRCCSGLRCQEFWCWISKSSEQTGVVIRWLWMMPEDQELYHLFAFPLERNFSGAKFYLDLITQIQQGGNCGKKHL